MRKVSDEENTDSPVGNVFVLSTGRCGSVTFAKACGRMTNFTSGHETLWKKLGDDRLNYPDRHIEVDNRLAWYLGRLEAKFGDDATYVHLIRDKVEVARSYDRRWTYPGSIALAYARGIVQTPVYNFDGCLDLVHTVTANIEAFLANKTRVFRIDIADPKTAFAGFWHSIGARGDLDGALAAFDERNNQSSPADEAPKVALSLDPQEQAFIHFDRIIDMLHDERQELRKQLRLSDRRAERLNSQREKQISLLHDERQELSKQLRLAGRRSERLGSQRGKQVKKSGSNLSKVCKKIVARIAFIPGWRRMLTK